jgi:hypothetical protein
MIVPGSSYWNFAFGLEKGDVDKESGGHSDHVGPGPEHGVADEEANMITPGPSISLQQTVMCRDIHNVRQRQDPRLLICSTPAYGYPIESCQAAQMRDTASVRSLW